jgi:type VI secretion system secreted protein Hcp
MAVDILLKLATVEGESKIAEHKLEIDVLSWSWGMSQSGTMHEGGGGGAGKVSVQDLSVTKYVDKSSTNLIRACCNGEHFKTAELIMRKAGKTPLEYYKVLMEKVMVTSVSTGGSGGEDRLTENVSLNFAEMEVIYTPQEDLGEAGGECNIRWSIQGNEEL